MFLTLRINYAVRLLRYVAQQPERLCIIWELAQTCEISEAHLMKATQQRGPQDWIETVPLEVGITLERIR